jgi:hypothetical protein
MGQLATQVRQTKQADIFSPPGCRISSLLKLRSASFNSMIFIEHSVHYLQARLPCASFPFVFGKQSFPEINSPTITATLTLPIPEG